MRKPDFADAKTKMQISCAVTAQLISTSCFPYTDSAIPLLLNAIFQAPSILPRLYRLVYVGPGQKPRRPVFSSLGSCYV